MQNPRGLGVGTAMEVAAVTRLQLTVITIGPPIFTVPTMSHDLLTAVPIVRHCGDGARGAGGPGDGVDGDGAGGAAGVGGSKELWQLTNPTMSDLPGLRPKISMSTLRESKRFRRCARRIYAPTRRSAPLIHSTMGSRDRGTACDKSLWLRPKVFHCHKNRVRSVRDA